MNIKMCIRDRLKAIKNHKKTEMEEVCEAPPILLAYSLQMEWLGVDGVTRVNNSVRVEWWGTESRAVCEMLPEPQTDVPQRVSDFEFAGHCCRCFLQLVAFAAFVVVLARSTGFSVIRPASYRCQADHPIIVDYGNCLLYTSRCV